MDPLALKSIVPVRPVICPCDGREREGDRKRERESKVRIQKPGRKSIQRKTFQMDGTKPVMESTTEENQEEREESKGTEWS